MQSESDQSFREEAMFKVQWPCQVHLWSFTELLIPAVKLTKLYRAGRGPGKRPVHCGLADKRAGSLSRGW